MSNTEKPGMSQKKQLIMMVVLLAVCAVLVTWTVLLLKDRIDRNQTNEQISQLRKSQSSMNDFATINEVCRERGMTMNWYRGEGLSTAPTDGETAPTVPPT